MMRQFELVERVKAYDPDADEDMLNRAYVFAMKAHGSGTRATGDPYFVHPLEVAGILTDYRLDTASIVTALLHDTVEDTPVTHDDIVKLFSEEIATLVDGVTKLTRIELQSDQTKQAENFRKLVLAMSKDLRVLLVKLADRLHNMRTIYPFQEDKRSRIAVETMEIYAPLAERIGMQEIKNELEDLAFAQINPSARDSIVKRLEFLRQRSGNLVPGIGRTVAPGDAQVRSRGGRLGPREDAAFDLAQDAAQQRRLRTAFRHHGLPRRGEGCFRLLTARSAPSTARIPSCLGGSRTTSARPSRTGTVRCTPACSAPTASASRSRSATA